MTDRVNNLLDTTSLENILAMVQRAINHTFQAEAVALTVGTTAGLSASLQVPNTEFAQISVRTLLALAFSAQASADKASLAIVELNNAAEFLNTLITQAAEKTAPNPDGSASDERSKPFH